MQSSNIEDLIKVSTDLFDKRFLVFAFDDYDSYGGMDDLIGCFSDREGLEKLFLSPRSVYDKFQIVDSVTGSQLDVEVPSFVDKNLLLNEICKKLVTISIGKHIENSFEDFKKLNPSFDREEVVSHLNKLIYSFKLNGYISSYLDLEMLVNLLNRGKINLFLEFLPIVIDKLDRDNKVPKSCISDLRNIV